MVIIYTGIKEIDNSIQNEIEDSIVAYYKEYLVENDNFKNQTVILAADILTEDLEEYLFVLKEMNIRVILLIKNNKQESVKIALKLGIYDFVFGNFYPSQIKEIIEKPRNFKEISKVYAKVFNINMKKYRKNLIQNNKFKKGRNKI